MSTEELLALPKLGFGMMRLPEKDGAINTERVGAMVDLFLENGFTYFDTAYPYHNGKSEGALKAALVDRYPRGRFTVADKMPGWLLKSRADAERIFNEQLERTGAGYFDFYLLHSVETGHLPAYDGAGCWDWALKMKQKGLIRHFGFSFHDSPELLDRLLTAHPQAEFVQLQINYLDWESETVRSRRCYETARRHGKPVVIMEPVKGGALASLRPELEAKLRAVDPEKSPASWALRFCATLPGVATVLSGMSSEEQVRDNIATVKALAPFTPREKACLEEVRQGILSTPKIGCTACRYCVDGCPAGIRIPDVIRAYNEALAFGNGERPRGLYADALKKGHPASACIGCGQCAGVCPQHLPVPDLMQKISAAFDR